MPAATDSASAVQERPLKQLRGSNLRGPLEQSAYQESKKQLVSVNVPLVTAWNVVPVCDQLWFVQELTSAQSKSVVDVTCEPTSDVSGSHCLENIQPGRQVSKRKLSPKLQEPKERKDKLSKAKSENNAPSKAQAAAADAEVDAARRALEVAVASGDQADISQAQAALKDAQTKTIYRQGGTVWP